MSSKSKYIPTRTALTFHECPQVMGKLRKKRKVRVRMQKKSRSKNRRK